MELATCLSSCSVVLRYLVSGTGAIHGEFPLRRSFSYFHTFIVHTLFKQLGYILHVTIQR